MSKHKNLVHQITSELMSQRRYGQSKYKARRDEGTRNPEGIFSKKTFSTYNGLCREFGYWATATYRCRSLPEARTYVAEYIQIKIAAGLSPWTIKVILSALAKLYRVQTSAFKVETPSRERKDIERSRSKPTDKYEEKHKEIFDFVKGCGLRRKELNMLRGEDVYRDAAGNLFIHVRNGKGGKERTVTPLIEYAEHIEKMAARVSPEELIFKSLPEGALHYYRGCFAKAMYERLARPAEDIPEKERYIMRKDRAGEILDKRAMLQVSRQLGHNRIDVIAGNYLYH